MAAKSKKRLCNKNENKLLKLDKLQLNDVICSVCQSILVEPVTLPCFHDFCIICFNGSIENNALCCPLCRLRIGSWLRSTTKQKNLVNVELWNFLKYKFPKEIELKSKGDEIDLPEDKPLLRLSAPGEIRSEYEAELIRLKAERLQLEQKHLEETELLVKKIQEEEEEAHSKYLDRLKQDEILAQAIQESGTQNLPSISLATHPSKKRNVRSAALKARFKVIKIDNFLSKKKSPVSSIQESPLITDDNTSTDSSIKGASKASSQTSPEMVPTCSKYLKGDALKGKNSANPWNKENGSDQTTLPAVASKEKLKGIGKGVSGKSKQSLPVSLGYGVLQLRRLRENLDEDSEDSMSQELCYFKPIEGITPTSFKADKGLPLRVPVRRAAPAPPPPRSPAPADSQCLEGLCRLRNISLAQNLPSAFAIALNILRAIKEKSPKSLETHNKLTVKKIGNSPLKRQSCPKNKPHIEGINALNNRTSLRRTRSMGSISRDETTPKKAKIQDRKVASERKPHLRSDTKKCDAKKLFNSPSRITDASNNNEVILGVETISSRLGNTHMKVILEEQLRIQRMIEQEQSDLELARKLDAEENGRRRALRRAAAKRPRPLPAAPQSAKKLRVH